jgi:hypothetical protein
MEIKTAEEILKPYMFIGAGKVNISDAIKCINIARKEILDYASENVEVHCNQLFGFMKDDLEIYVPKGEFDKIKELIK